jgi:hypothetical protein
VADRKIPGNPENKIRHSEKIEKALVRRMVPLRPPFKHDIRTRQDIWRAVS